MNTPVKALLITSFPLWADACAKALAPYARPIAVNTLAINTETDAALEKALPPALDIILIALELPFESFAVVRAIRALEYGTPILVIGDQYAGFNSETLAEVGVQGVLPIAADVAALAESIYRLADQAPTQSAPYKSHLVVKQTPLRPVLNTREKEVLQLLAVDMTDQEIAARLGISKRTASNHLHHVYAKLGVKGRAGALGIALTFGLIKLDFSYQHNIRGDLGKQYK